MNKNFLNMILTVSCVLTLLTGCGNTARQIPPAAAESTDNKQSVRHDAGTESSDYITLAEAKSVVLKNAGLSEEDVSFVRAHLDSERDAVAYDIEFICEDVEYDYAVHAVTGEILSMTSQQNSSAPEQKSSVNDSNVEEEQYIGIETAKQTALNHVGLNEADVNFVHAHLEQDDGVWKYDIEFHKDNTEYDYDIDALSGEILSYDHDVKYSRHEANVSSSAEKITEDNAKEIALNHAGVAEQDTQRLKIEFDYDNGRAKYEIEWHIGQTEYSCDVDAYTGEILSFEKELD